MKLFVDYALRIKHKSHLLFDKVMKKEPNKNEIKFNKVECYNVTSNNNKGYRFINIERNDPLLIKLSDTQKKVLNNYIKKSLYDYHKGTIYINEDVLKNYTTVKNAIESNTEVSKDTVDFVLAEMHNSYNTQGHSKQIIENDEDYFEIRHK